METALFNFSSGESNKEKVYSTALISLLMSSTLFIGLMMLSSDSIANLIEHSDHVDYVQWILLIIALDAFTSIPFAKLREQNKAKRFAVIKLINIAVNIGFNLFFIALCKPAFENAVHPFHEMALKIYDPAIGVGYVFISNLAASFVTLLCLLPAMFKIKFEFDRTLWGKMIVYALPLLLAGLPGMVNETLDRGLLKYMLPKDVALSQVGIYGACYKISILMTIFIQTFRYAAEPFFFSHSKEKDPKPLYAAVMNYFVIACSFIFLATMANMSWIKFFVGKDYWGGLNVVPILLLANLFLGVFFNLSIWYKLSNKTRFGAYLTILGAVITLVLNFFWIPTIGYVGSAWATLICYGTMMIVSYFIGNKHFKVNYDLKRILGYLSLSVALWLVGSHINLGSKMLGFILNNMFVLFFIGVVYYFEKDSLKEFVKSADKDHQ